MPTSPKLYIGLDAGGTKTEMVAGYEGGKRTVRLTGPAANLQRQGLSETAHALALLIKEALQQSPRSSLHAVCAGVAGAGVAADREALAAALRGQLGPLAPPHLLIVHDAAIALEGAFEGGSGIIVIAGTGSMSFARTRRGTLLRAGGWGYLLGDEGSGHALGIQGLRAVVHAFDGGPPTLLQPLLAEQHGIATPEALVHHVYRDGWQIQQMAPLVVEAAAKGDAEALRIVGEQTQALAQQVQWLAHRAGDVAPRLSLLGGLTRAPYYNQALSAALRDLLPGWLLQQPALPPVEGALRLAKAAS